METATDVKTCEPLAARRSRVARAAVDGEALVQKSRVPGHLIAEPCGRLEASRLLLGVELDLGDDQALELVLVEVDLDLEAIVGDDVAALPQAPALGQWPECLELLAAQLDLGLPAGEARPPLHGQQRLLPLPAEANLAVCADREVALLDRVGVGAGEIGEPVEPELALDLHSVPT